MVLVFEGTHRPLDSFTLRSMFEARKRVFVDLLKWDVPVLDGRFELDQFDDEGAVYLVMTDDDGSHLGSARLLETSRPHILDTIFPELCADGPVRDSRINEITRGSHASAPQGRRNSRIESERKSARACDD